MQKVRALALVLAAGFAVGSYATDARVAVMGRQNTPWFFRDEVTVFTNPADMSLYPNMLYGSFGWMANEDWEGRSAIWYENTSPRDPFFGALFSHRLSGEDGGPMLSIGAFMNRRDPMLNRIMTAGGVRQVMRPDNFGFDVVSNLEEPLGKFDFMVGYDMGNGVSIGAGVYTAVQTKKSNGNIDSQTEFYKGSFGLNWNIEQGLDLEAAVNFGAINASFTPSGAEKVIVSDGEYALRGDVRFFSAVPAINGSFVPQVSLEYLRLNEQDMIDLNGGVGVNMNIDRGFFWAGLQGVYTQVNGGSDDEQSIGARVSFGIERNIVWDWFLVRVGGSKEFRHVSKGDGTTSEWRENVPSDGSDGDLVGLGFGVNIDNRLRIDFVVSEALPYTFTNLLSGGEHHLFNRVSATYRF
ncbi:MAG: hypothetical protein LBC70_08325 [Chitinispirillales bacterium]|nr:hypothetical protein [Chitinispirillales bacterium]